MRISTTSKNVNLIEYIEAWSLAERIWLTSVLKTSSVITTSPFTLLGEYTQGILLYGFLNETSLRTTGEENMYHTAVSPVFPQIQISSLFHLLYYINLFRILPGFFLHSNSSLLRNILAWIYKGGRRVRFSNADCWIAIDELKYVPSYESIYSKVLTDTSPEREHLFTLKGCFLFTI